MKPREKQERAGSGRRSLSGYVLAVLIAIQPLLNSEVDFYNRADCLRYVLRLVFAISIAVLAESKKKF